MFSITYRRGDFEVVLSADTIEGVLALDDAYNAEDDDNGWIEWKGGKCPVAYGTIVSVQLRSGMVHYIEEAGIQYWRHRNHPDDIVAYKVVKNV